MRFALSVVMPFEPFAWPVVSAVVLCLAAIALDLRERRIPNWLTYSFVFFVLVQAFLLGKLSAAFAFFSVASFVFAYIAYRLGAWAGGDAKFFTALLMHFPLIREAEITTIVLVFLASAAVLVPILLLVYSREMACRSGKLLALLLACLRPSLSGGAMSCLLFLVGSLVFGVGVTPVVAVKVFASSTALVLVLSFLSKAFSLLSKEVLRREKRIGELKEGDVPAVSVFLRKGKPLFWSPPGPTALFASALRLDLKALRSFSPPIKPIADCLRARGLYGEEIKQLKEVGVRKLAVKESFPFAPALVLGFWLVLWLS